jgi:alcohol dehydrogenase class IV
LVIQFYSPKKLIVGTNAVLHVIDVLHELHVSNVFLLYSRSAVSSELLQLLRTQGDKRVMFTCFEMPKGEPTFAMLRIAVSLFQEARCDGVVAIGGGSAIDLAKAVAAISKNPKQKFEQLGNQSSIERYPLVAIPTTAGTGSEATKISVLIDEVKNVKYNPGHPDLIPDVAILDPNLTRTIPKQITAQTGIDALTHAIEAYVSTKANDLSNFYALQAIHLIHQSILKVYHETNDLKAREQMLLGSYYAGLAFSNASTNLAHATGRALGTMWAIPHGLSVALTHPFVVQHFYGNSQTRYDKIATLLGLQSGEEVAHYLLTLNDELHIWQNAKKLLQVDFINSIEIMTTNALNGNGILTNAKVPTKEDVEDIFYHLFNHLAVVLS